MSKDIIGISIGSKNTVIGTYKNGTFEVVLSETSSRSTPTVVSYNNRERNYGEISQSKNRSNYKNTVIYPNRWLGIQNNYSFYKEESKYSNIPPKRNNYNLLSFNINFKGNKEYYTPECLMGLFFQKIKNVWLKQNINTNNVVVSIPDYSTVQERKAMLESISIGGLNCTSLLNESSAISLAYGFQKLKEFQDKTPRLVAFIDLGHSHTNIFYSEFTKNFIKVVSVSSERFCGAREFDYLIAEKLAYEFQKRYGVDPLDSPKAKISLINAVNKARKTLTVNKEVTISVDSLMEGQDLVYNLKREEFEAIISSALRKFENLCRNSIQKAMNMGININNLHSVEMVGDTLRTPIITNIIKNVFKRDLSKTLVPDECIARGCALFAMMNSPYYAIKNFGFHHYNPYLILIECPNINQFRQEILMPLNVFLEGENIPSSKIINFNRSQLPFRNNIIIKFSYHPNDPNLNFLPNKAINSYNIYLPIEKQTDWKLNLIYSLDVNCIPQLAKASIKETVVQRVPITNPNPNMSMNQNNGQQFRDELREIETPIKFEILLNNFGTPNNILNDYINRENTQNYEDTIIHKAISFKNSLEQYIYDTRNKIDSNGELSKYAAEDEKIILNNKMDDLMNWLYSEDESLYNYEKLEEKSTEVRKLGDEIYKRFNEWNKLNEKYEKISSILNDTILFCSNEDGKIKAGQKAELLEEDIAKIREIINDTFKKLAEKKNLSDKKNYINLPPVSPDEIDMLINSLNDNFNKIRNKAKEKKKEEKNKEEKQSK